MSSMLTSAAVTRGWGSWSSKLQQQIETLNVKSQILNLGTRVCYFPSETSKRTLLLKIPRRAIEINENALSLIEIEKSFVLAKSSVCGDLCLTRFPAFLFWSTSEAKKQVATTAIAQKCFEKPLHAAAGKLLMHDIKMGASLAKEPHWCLKVS